MENIERNVWPHAQKWRIKYSNKLYTMYRECNIVTYIKLNHLRWTGHVIYVEEQSPTRRVLVAVVEGRTKGQAEIEMGRWCDGRCQEVGGQKLEECCKE